MARRRPACDDLGPDGCHAAARGRRGPRSRPGNGPDAHLDRDRAPERRPPGPTGPAPFLRACRRLAGRPHPGVVHAPGRPFAARVPRGPGRRATSSTPSPTPSWRPSSPSSRSAATASTPPSCSPTSWCRCTPSASGSTWCPGRGPVVAEPFRTGRRPGPPAPARARGRRRPTSPRRCGWSAARAGPRGAAHRLRRRPLHRGQLPGRGRAVAHLRQGEVLHARRPELWGSLVERLADMAVASLRAQVAAGASAVQLFDSWAGCLSPDEYRALRPPRHPPGAGGCVGARGCRHPALRRGHRRAAGLMGTAGADVVGVDWRVPLDEARRRVGPGHAVQGNLDPAICLAPAAVVAAETRRVLAAAGTEPGPRLQPGPRRAARDRPRHPGRRGRPGARRGTGRCRARRTRVGVLVMAHGTPARPGRDRGLLHPHPPGQPAVGRAAGRPAAALRRHRRAPPRWPPAPPPRWPAWPRRLEAAEPGRYLVRFGAKHTAPLIEEAAAGLAAAGVGAGGRAWSSPPTAPRWGRASTWPGRPRPWPTACPFTPVDAVVRGAGVRRAAGRAAARPPWPGSGRRPGVRSSCSPPTRCPSGWWPPATPTPTRWPRRRRRWPPRRAWPAAAPPGRWPGRAPAAPPSPGSGPTSCDGARRPGRRGLRRRGGLPDRLRLPTTSRSSTTSTSRPGRGRDGRAGLRPHRLAQRRPALPGASWPGW